MEKCGKIIVSILLHGWCSLAVGHQPLHAEIAKRASGCIPYFFVAPVPGSSSSVQRRRKKMTPDKVSWWSEAGK